MQALWGPRPAGSNDWDLGGPEISCRQNFGPLPNAACPAAVARHGIVAYVPVAATIASVRDYWPSLTGQKLTSAFGVERRVTEITA